MTAIDRLIGPGCGCDVGEGAGGAISLDAALERIAAHAAPVAGTEEALSPAAAAGRVLARPVAARAAAPPFDNAAMDGYAVATRALSGEGPWWLSVTERVAAGQGAPAPLPGAMAARIFTGAPIPPGADAVVMQEHVHREGDAIRLDARPAPGLNLRRAGEDMAAAQLVLDAGRQLGPREIAAAAAAGAETLHVRRRLRVALLVTGDEVQPAGAAPAAATIPDVNAPMLAAALAGPAVELVAVAHGGDDRAALTRRIADLAARADLVVTTGGLSVGEADHVAPALAALGAEVCFAGVAIKPGKPVAFGRLGAATWLGLPGNPLAAFVTWHIFGRALLRRLAGQTHPAPARRHLVTATAIHRTPGRCEIRPAAIAGCDAEGREIVRFEAATQSGRVAGLPGADGLMFLPAQVDHLPAGALVEFEPFAET